MSEEEMFSVPESRRDMTNRPFPTTQLILESQKWERVHLVYHDMSNPVVPLIMDYCRAHKLLLETQSSDLPTDLTTLLGAENLVAGRGSFIPAVVGLSPHCKNVFYFEDKTNVIPSVSGINVFQVRDATGDYRSHVLSNNWENSSEQRQLMTTYPCHLWSWRVRRGDARVS
jgi:hypothetical protein